MSADVTRLCLSVLHQQARQAAPRAVEPDPVSGRRAAEDGRCLAGVQSVPGGQQKHLAVTRPQSSERFVHARIGLLARMRSREGRKPRAGAFLSLPSTLLIR